MSRSRKILALLGMVLVLALAGCVRFQADLSVDDHDLLNGSIVVAVITNDEPGAAEHAKAQAADIEDQLLPGVRVSDGVTAEPYAEDDYVGTRFTLKDTPLQVLQIGDQDHGIYLAHTGDRFIFSGVLDFTPGDDSGPTPAPGDPKDADIRVSMHFPGEITTTNGEVDGTTVTWTTTLEGKVEMRAIASAIPSVFVPSPALIIGGVVAVALLVGVITLWVRRYRRESAG